MVLCPDCHKEFAHPRNLLQHRRVQHQGVRYYCSDCTHSYTRQYNLTHHRLKSHPEKMPSEEVEMLKQKLMYPTMVTQIRNSAITNQRKRKPEFVQKNGSILFNPFDSAEDDFEQLSNEWSHSELFSRNQNRKHGNEPMTFDEINPGKNPEFYLGSETSSSQLDRAQQSQSNLSKKHCNGLTSNGQIRKSGSGISSCPICPFQSNINRRHFSRHPILNRFKDEATVTENGIRGKRNSMENWNGSEAPGRYCRFCDYRSPDPITLSLHTPIHFASPSLNSRIKTLEPIKLTSKFSCSFCGLQFKTSRAVEAHEIRHRPLNEPC